MIKQKVSLHNRFDIEVRDAKTGELKQQAYAENIVLNSFWPHLNSDRNIPFHAIHFGSGTGTIAASRTTLFSQIAFKVAVTDSFTENKEELYTKTVKHITITELEYIGQTLKEVGIGAGYDTYSSLVTHALLKDMNGNTVEILKTDMDIITIYASLYVYYSNLDNYATTDNGHVILSYPSGSLLANMIARWLGGVAPPQLVADDRYSELVLYYGNSPAGTETTVGRAYTARATKTFDLATKKLSLYCRVPAASGNAGINGTKGIGSLALFPSMADWTDIDGSVFYEVSSILDGSSGFPEGVVIEEPLLGGDGIKTRFQTVFNRLKSVTKVTVNGVETSAYTVPQLVVPYSNRIDELMKIVDASARAPGYYSPGGRQQAGAFTILENPLYETNPLYQIRLAKGSISCSNDLENWTLLATYNSATTLTIAAQYRNYRYWKYITVTTESLQPVNYVTQWIIETPTDYNNIQFDSPPGLVQGENVGSGDGTEDDFVLDFTPIAGSVVMLLDGVETSAFTVSGATVTFTNPPANGVAITANYRFVPTILIDYKTTCAPKDASHVLDTTIQFQFGEYVPA